MRDEKYHVGEDRDVDDVFGDGKEGHCACKDLNYNVVVVVGGGGGGDVAVSYLVYFRSVILSMVNNVWLKMRLLFTVETSQNTCY